MYPGIGEYKVEISVFMLPLTAPPLVIESLNQRSIVGSGLSTHGSVALSEVLGPKSSATTSYLIRPLARGWSHRDSREEYGATFHTFEEVSLPQP